MCTGLQLRVPISAVRNFEGPPAGAARLLVVLLVHLTKLRVLDRTGGAFANFEYSLRSEVNNFE